MKKYSFYLFTVLFFTKIVSGATSSMPAEYLARSIPQPMRESEINNISKQWIDDAQLQEYIKKSLVILTETNNYDFLGWIKRIAIETQTPMPVNVIIDRLPLKYSDSPVSVLSQTNDSSNYILQINRELIQILNIDELQAVIEHEFAHIRNKSLKKEVQLKKYSDRAAFYISRMAYIAGIFALYKVSDLPTDLTNVEMYSWDFWMTIVNTVCLHDIAAVLRDITANGIHGIKNYFLRQDEKNADLEVRNAAAMASALEKFNKFCEEE